MLWSRHYYLLASADEETEAHRALKYLSDHLASKWQRQNWTRLPGSMAPALCHNSLQSLTCHLCQHPLILRTSFASCKNGSLGRRSRLSKSWSRAQHFQHSGLSLTLGSQRPKVGRVIFSLEHQTQFGPAVSSSQSETKSLCWFEGNGIHCVLLPFVINIVNEGIFCLRLHNPSKILQSVCTWSIREKAVWQI